MHGIIDLDALVHEIGPGFAERAAGHDEADSFVAENYRVLRERKVFSAMVPRELGGGGGGYGEMAAFLRSLGRYCSSTALALSMHQHLTAAAVFNWRNDRPGWKVLERIARDEIILVSTGANDWLESNGTVERADGGFLVSARKPFASGSPAGDVLVTSAPYLDPKEGWQVLHFPVPLSADGVTLGEDWRAMGMRGTGSHTVSLHKVFVPEDSVALRRPRGDYHGAFNVVLAVAAPLIMSAYLGIAEAAAEIAISQARRRADDAATPLLLGELTNALTTAQVVVADMVAIANDWDFAPVAETADAMVVRKTIAANAVLATVEKAMEAVGGGGYFRKTGIERLVRDAHGVRYHPLQEKRQLLFTGRLALGLDPIRDKTGARAETAAA